jgi:ParB/RepB/Spo0J family partition protein
MDDAAPTLPPDALFGAISSDADSTLSLRANLKATSVAGDAPPPNPGPFAFANDECTDMPFDPSEEYAQRKDLPTLWRRKSGSRLRPNTPNGPVLDIPLARISTAGLDNVRSSEDEAQFRGLIASMDSSGLINPITVVVDAKEPGKFIVICGFRRFRAACELGWPSIKASVREIASVADAYLLNLMENQARATISTYDLAFRCELLARHFKMPVTELAKQLGYSPSHVHNLIRLLGALPKSISEDWKAGHPLLSIARLDRLSHDTLGAEGKWQVMRRQFTKEESKAPPSLEEQFADLEDAEFDAARDPTGFQPFKRPSKAAIMRVRDIISRQRMPDDPQKFRAMAVGLCDFFRGATTNIPYVMAPPLKKRRRPAGGAFAGMSRSG